jgi:hypothetical protein
VGALPRANPSGVTGVFDHVIGHSLNPKLMEVGGFHYIFPFRAMLMRSAVIFFVLLLWLLSLPSAASAGPLSLYGPFDETHYGVHSEPASSPEYGALGLREGPLSRSENFPVQRTGSIRERPHELAAQPFTDSKIPPA